MTLNRNLGRSLATRQIRILNNYIDRTINILTRSNNNVAVLVNLSRNLIAILIGSRNLGVLIRVGDLDTSVLLLIGRLNRLHTRIINLGRLLGVLADLDRGLSTVGGTIGVGHAHQDVFNLARLELLPVASVFARGDGDFTSLLVDGGLPAFRQGLLEDLILGALEALVVRSNRLASLLVNKFGRLGRRLLAHLGRSLVILRGDHAGSAGDGGEGVGGQRDTSATLV